MMSTIRKLQDTWVAKGIFILTALSFMSLFGISGYINSAGQNRTVIKVNDIEISQGEISYQYDKELNTARQMFGDAIEINDNMRASILLGIVQKQLVDAIIKTVAQENDVVIGDDLIRKVIYSQSEFMNNEGQFDPRRFKMILSLNGMSEQEYIQALRTDIERQQLVQNPVARINVPSFLTDLLGKIENQQRVFAYVKIVPEKLKLDREITDDELQQYYQDFAENFTAPEKRDIAYIAISADKIAEKYNPSQAEIDAYYQANISEFETPEKRNILQMVFSSQDEAQKAKAKLDQGADFYAVAADLAKQSKADTELGDVSKDMLLAEVAEDVFTLPKGGVSQPLQSEFGWHIMKVTGITPASKMSKDKAYAKAAEALRQEKAYDAVYEYTQKIEDKIGAGASLEDIAADFGSSIVQVKNLTEDGKATSTPQILSQELVDAGFSYNIGEISQVIETDTGLAVVRVDNIYESHQLDIDEVKPQIVKMWADNEREAMAQEMANDIMSDMENGGSITEAAKRLGLSAMTSRPIKKSETFDSLPSSQIFALFQENVGTPKLIEQDGDKLIVTTAKIVKDTHKLSDQEKADIRNSVRMDLTSEAANLLIENYSKDYDVDVNYKLLGLADQKLSQTGTGS